MAGSQGFSPRASLGMELRAGHVRKDRYGRSPAPAASHRPVRNKRKSRSAASHASNPERPNIPEQVGPLELPRLRALEARAAAIPIGSSAASSASPRSGSSRAHPYPVGEAIEGSSFEMVPSMATRATNNSGRDESVDITPIRRTDSSPDLPIDPEQVRNTKKNRNPGNMKNTQNQDIGGSEGGLKFSVLATWIETPQKMWVCFWYFCKV